MQAQLARSAQIQWWRCRFGGRGGGRYRLLLMMMSSRRRRCPWLLLLRSSWIAQIEQLIDLVVDIGGHWRLNASCFELS